MTRKRIALTAVALAVVIAGTHPARSDDSDIFTQNSIQPNVVILIDSSGSMDDRVNGVRKIVTARNAVSNLVQSVTGMRYSIFAFNDDSTGAMLVAPVGTATATMVTEIQALQPQGRTPLGRASQDIENYFRGTFREGTAGYGCGDSGGWYNRHGAGAGGGCPIVTYPSPIQFSCQKNFYIVITDGLPNGEATTLVSDVARSLYTTDHSTSLAGMQNVVTYTIGFDIAEAGTLLQQTATNGGGQYYPATDATSLNAGLQSALSAIIVGSYSFASPLVPSTSASVANVAYLSSFTPGAKAFWRGNLQAYRRDSTGSIPVDANNQPLASALLWDAGALLNAKTASSRAIYTELAGSLVPFATTNSSITQALLGVGTSTARDNLIEYVRGVDRFDEDQDGVTTEQRGWKLGDIFHSTPVLVFPPPLSGVDASYDTFKAANASRTQIVLVGANDGMLHAFRTSDGQELWSFIPRDKLIGLQGTEPSQLTHAFGVDSSPTVADVKIGGVWKTIVVVGERRGGRSYQALDITDTTAPAFLWSFTDTLMGETWSQPAIGRVAMADGTTKHVAFVGGGYNTANNNVTGKAVFVIDVANGQKLWQYSNTGANDSALMNFSIPATPAIVHLDGDGNVNRMYIGDVGGQLWKFDVSAPATFTSGVVNNWTGKLLFKAAPSAANPPAAGDFYAPQAMYGRPTLAYDSNRALWVYVGTGDRNHPNATGQSAFYGIKDNTTMSNGLALTPASLVDATATNSSIGQGWSLPLSTSEKVLASAEVHGNTVYFGTYTPSPTITCEAPSGVAKLYAVQMATGDAAFDWGTGAMLSPENGGTRSQTIGGGITSMPQVVPGSSSSSTDAVVTATTNGEVVTTPRPRVVRKQVLSWREVP